MSEAIFKNILQFTEEMEQLLKKEKYDEIAPILKRRKEAIDSLEHDPSFSEPEAVFWRKKIGVVEKRCADLAEFRKKKAQQELLAMQNGKRALHAYGRQV